MNLLYFIGEPGVGKTTLLGVLTDHLARRPARVREGFACTQYANGLMQLGVVRPNGFGGTDSLSMSVQPRVIEMLESKRFDKIVGEGDRLSNAAFFQAAQQAGYELDVVLLEAPEEVLTERRKQRGSNQNETWMRGRRTKVANLAPWATMRLDATRPTGELVADLKDHPVFITEA